MKPVEVLACEKKYEEDRASKFEAGIAELIEMGLNRPRAIRVYIRDKMSPENGRNFTTEDIAIIFMVLDIPYSYENEVCNALDIREE